MNVFDTVISGDSVILVNTVYVYRVHVYFNENSRVSNIQRLKFSDTWHYCV